MNTQNYNISWKIIWLCSFERSKACKTGIDDHCSVSFCAVGSSGHCALFLGYWFALSAWGAPLSQRQFANRAFTPLPLMKIHTKHLALCEKGGKFNKTHNTIYKLQEELIEPTGKMERFLCLYLLILLHFRNHSSSCLCGGSLQRLESIFSAKMKSSAVFLLGLLFHADYQSCRQRCLH